MHRQLLILSLLVTLTACGHTPEPRVITKEIKVPVATKREPPAALAKPYHPGSVPHFLPAGHEDAVIGLSPAGVKDLKRLIFDFLSRDKAWREWATAD